MGSSEDIRENQMVCSDEDRRAFDFSSEDLEVGCDAARVALQMASKPNHIHTNPF